MSNPYEYDYDKNNRINLFPMPSVVFAAPSLPSQTSHSFTKNSEACPTGYERK